jgi:flagellar M-ring protein FliF
MPLPLQAKLLRALQEGEVVPIGATQPVKVDVRVIACANRDLPLEVQEGRFRADLYYRLNVFPLGLKPLRDRMDDIAALAFALLLRHAPQGRPAPWIGDAAIAMLRNHSWPGRPEHIHFDGVARLVAAAEAPSPASPASNGKLSNIVQMHEARAIMDTLEACGGSPAPQRTLYSELDDGGRAKVVAALDKAAISYSIDSTTGALTVGEDDLYRARMLVASDGALAAPEDGASLDNLPLGASRTLEGDRLRSARAHELNLSIMEIDGVEAVRVHLAEAERSVFVRDNLPPTASVMVRLARGRQLSESQVAGIVNIVAGSVPGLSPDAVRVVDQHGRLLTERGSGNSERLELQGRLEDKLRSQIDGLLTPMLGAGNFSSEVQVDLDMDQVTSARESYDKQGVVRSETEQQSRTTGPASAVGVPGILSNTPPVTTTAKPGPPLGTPPLPATPPVSGESSATRNYELGREVAVSNGAPGKITRLSVAVALSANAMKRANQADIAQIRQLVSAAVGADPTRGDQVAVIARAFDETSVDALPIYQAPWFLTLARYGAALLGVVLVLLFGVRPLVKAISGKAEEARRIADLPARPEEPEAEATATGIDATLLGRQVGFAQRLVDEKPESAVKALRQMLAQPDPEAAS